ncbi:aldo/keto reductase [Haloarcula japonica]|uniref:Aldo/keto reductase n=1 Tax=Haloarcula japonica (strain ATCC 49778 / DSM 6131 / JCM 7785 / NBRC 101032 / NCIMB 13157 / TR-1) TaxID=1227453 RepID=M0LMC8_HALJT|nr:aldo/keto reductase [Haloarcula japonica]EMA33609.1 aldo/keto reductase [Haloarcula japonica DSM 6131]
MNRRQLGTTGYDVTDVGLGTWNIGGDWGDVSEEEGRETIRTALDAGIDFIDTADVYGDGFSEQRIAEVLDEREVRDEVTVATKAGRRLDPHTAERYNYDNLSEHVDRSREYLGADTLELLQLHCPPTDAYYQPETFDALARLRDEGKVAHCGVSVERVEEALKAIEYPEVETVQIIFNMFRQRPAERFFEEAKRRDVGVIVRVPLASGLLTGKLSRDMEFPENDHRNFNIEGEAFDRGETFAGLPVDAGFDAVEELHGHVPERMTMAQMALRWILDHDAVSTVIPGSTNPDHVQANAAVSEMAPLSNQVHGAVRDIYEEYVFDDVHHRW